MLSELKKPYKAKIFGWVTLFIIATYFIFPSGVYEKYLGHDTDFPNSTIAIPSTTIYKDAVVALTPWLTFSLWGLLDNSLYYCGESIGCIFFYVKIPVVLLSWYIILTLLLIKIFKPEQSRARKRIYIGILATLWILYSAFGFNVVYNKFVVVAQKYNGALEKLQTISGKASFPPNTEVFRSGVFDYFSRGWNWPDKKNAPSYLTFRYKLNSGQDFFSGNIYFGHISKEDLLKRCSRSGNIEQRKPEKDLLPTLPEKYLFSGDNVMLLAKDTNKFGQYIWPTTDYISEEAPDVFACKDSGAFVGYLGSNRDVYFFGQGPEQPRQNDSLFINIHRTVPEFLKYYLR